MNNEAVKTIHYKKCKIEIFQDIEGISAKHFMEDLKNDNAGIGRHLMNYHDDCYIENNDIMTKEQVRAWYRNEKTKKLKNYWIFEVSFFSHGPAQELKLHRTGFVGDSGGWDTSHVGVALIEKRKGRTEKKAEKIAEDLVKKWNYLLRNEIYGFVITDQFDNQIDSICGFVGELENCGVIEDAKIEVDSYIKNDLPKVKQERERRKTLERHEVNLLELSGHKDNRIVRNAKSLIKLLKIA